MPTYGTCQMCKETAYLTAKVLRNKETGSLHLFMLCDCCRKFYEKTCATCKYRSDDFTSACVNGESEHCADFVSEDDWCEKWEGKDDER